MAGVTYTPDADLDLRRIVQHIALDDLAAAVRWLTDIQALCELLADQPELGQRIQTRRSGELRRQAADRYLVYYRPIAGGVEIVRVLHGARRQDRLI